MKKEEIIKKIVQDLPMPCLRDGMTDSEWYGWFEEAYNKGEEQAKALTLGGVGNCVCEFKEPSYKLLPSEGSNYFCKKCLKDI